MRVRLSPIPPEQEDVLQNLMQLYVHDFSEFWAGTTRGEVEADGRFAPYPMAAYWTDPVRSAAFIWRDDVLAGFALVNDHAHSGLPIDQSVAEFFVLRKHRRSGLAAQAARLVFASRPGLWEVAVTRKNAVALSFWRRATADAPGATDIQELDVVNDDWDGPIIRFRRA